MTHKNNQKLIPPHGGYRKLKSYQNSEIVYDLTVEFCRRYMSRMTNGTYTRTYDQMVQAARSGKQNRLIRNLVVSISPSPVGRGLG